MYGEIFFFILIPYASNLSYSIFTLNTALIWIRIHNTASKSYTNLQSYGQCCGSVFFFLPDPFIAHTVPLPVREGGGGGLDDERGVEPPQGVVLQGPTVGHCTGQGCSYNTPHNNHKLFIKNVFKYVVQSYSIATRYGHEYFYELYNKKYLHRS